MCSPDELLKWLSPRGSRFDQEQALRRFLYKEGYPPNSGGWKDFDSGVARALPIFCFRYRRCKLVSARKPNSAVPLHDSEAQSRHRDPVLDIPNSPNRTLADTAADRPFLASPDDRDHNSMPSVTHWIEVTLLGQDDKPIPEQRVRLTVPTGEIYTGVLDSAGRYRKEDLSPGVCTIAFPDLDGDVWYPDGDEPGEINPSGGPARLHSISENESVAMLAEAAGLFGDQIWDHPSNANIRAKRENATILRPGDQIHIPSISPKTEKRATNAHYVFRRRGIPALYRRRFLEGNEPIVDTPYEFEVDGDVRTGRTDAQGALEEFVPSDAERAEITLPDIPLVLSLRFRELRPIDNDDGIITRLTSLGFVAESDAPEDVASAVAAFQNWRGLDPTGQIDDALKSELTAAHDA